MATIIYEVDPIKRTVKPMSKHVITEQDHRVDTIRFAFPDSFSEVDLTAEGFAVRVMYIRPDGGDPVAKTLTFYRHSGGYYLYDWNLQKSDLSKEGGLTFSLCVFTVADGAVSVEWHTTPYQIRVLDTIHTDDGDSSDETITPTAIERIAVLEATMAQLGDISRAVSDWLDSHPDALSNDVIVHISESETGKIADKTYTELYDALLQGVNVVVIDNDTNIVYPYVGIIVQDYVTSLAFGISATYDQTTILNGYTISKFGNNTYVSYVDQSSDFYTKSEIDTKIGDIETLLAAI